MPDDDIREQELEATEEQATEGAEESAAGSTSSRKRTVKLAGLTLAAFVVSGILSLGMGGHFRRKPLSNLRDHAEKDRDTKPPSGSDSESATRTQVPPGIGIPPHQPHTPPQGGEADHQ